jgi:hypothetical protein
MTNLLSRTGIKGVVDAVEKVILHYAELHTLIFFLRLKVKLHGFAHHAEATAHWFLHFLCVIFFSHFLLSQGSLEPVLLNL